MSPVDVSHLYSHLFRCARCNSTGIIFLLKYTSHNIIVKTKCIYHGKKSFVIPIKSLKILLPVIKDSIFRCWKCGERTTIDTIKTDKTWTLIKGYCETHKNALPIQKISTNVYNMLQALDAPRPIVEDSKGSSALEAPEDNENLTVRYCANCGSNIDPNEKVCKLCGAAIVR